MEYRETRNGIPENFDLYEEKVKMAKKLTEKTMESYYWRSIKSACIKYLIRQTL